MKTILIVSGWLILICLLTYLSIQTSKTMGLAFGIGFGGVSITIFNLWRSKIAGVVNRRLLTTVNDLSWRMAQLEDANLYLKSQEEVMRRVVAILVHDIRTPIANLRLMIKLVLAANIDENDFRKYVGEFESDASSMLELANRILHWVDSNVSDALSIEPIDVRQEFASLFSMYREVAKGKRISLVMNVPGELVIQQDATHLNIILRNLIDNAIKFTASGGQVLVGCMEEGRDGYCFFVSNTFPRMSNEVIDELMSTNNAVNTRKGETTAPGLGLFFCKTCLNKLGSSLSIENSPMGFLTFSFNLKSVRPSEKGIGAGV